METVPIVIGSIVPLDEIVGASYDQDTIIIVQAFVVHDPVPRGPDPNTCELVPKICVPSLEAAEVDMVSSYRYGIPMIGPVTVDYRPVRTVPYDVEPLSNDHILPVRSIIYPDDVPSRGCIYSSLYRGEVPTSIKGHNPCP